MKNYPFLIRGPTTQGRVVKHSIIASSYKEALNVVLSLYPVKFVNSKFAIQMDLITVKKEAIKLSKSRKGEKITIYLNEAEGEFYITFKNAQGFTMLVEEEGQEPNEIGSARLNKWTPHGVYMNGSEIALEPEQQKKADAGAKKIPAQSEKAKKLIQKKEVTTKTTNEVKKSAAKKAAPAKKVAAKSDVTYKATRLGLTDAQWTKLEKLNEKEGSLQAMATKAVIKVYGL